MVGSVLEVISWGRGFVPRLKSIRTIDRPRFVKAMRRELVDNPNFNSMLMPDASVTDAHVINGTITTETPDPRQAEVDSLSDDEFVIGMQALVALAEERGISESRAYALVKKMYEEPWVVKTLKINHPAKGEMEVPALPATCASSFDNWFDSLRHEQNEERREVLTALGMFKKYGQFGKRFGALGAEFGRLGGRGKRRISGAG